MKFQINEKPSHMTERRKRFRLFRRALLLASIYGVVGGGTAHADSYTIPVTTKIPTGTFHTAKLSAIEPGMCSSGLLAVAFDVSAKDLDMSQVKIWRSDNNGAKASVAIVGARQGVSPGHLKINGSSLYFCVWPTDVIMGASSTFGLDALDKVKSVFDKVTNADIAALHNYWSDGLSTYRSGSKPKRESIQFIDKIKAIAKKGKPFNDVRKKAKAYATAADVSAEVFGALWTLSLVDTRSPLKPAANQLSDINTVLAATDEFSELINDELIVVETGESSPSKRDECYLKSRLQVAKVSDGQRLDSGGVQILSPRQRIRSRVKLYMYNADAADCRKSDDTDSIDVKWYFRVNGGSWQHMNDVLNGSYRDKTRVRNLDRGETHSETNVWDVPYLPGGSIVELRVKVDASDELHDKREDELVRKERFEIRHPSANGRPDFFTNGVCRPVRVHNTDSHSHYFSCSNDELDNIQLNMPVWQIEGVEGFGAFLQPGQGRTVLYQCWLRDHNHHYIETDLVKAIVGCRGSVMQESFYLLKNHEPNTVPVMLQRRPDNKGYILASGSNIDFHKRVHGYTNIRVVGYGPTKAYRTPSAKPIDIYAPDMDDVKPVEPLLEISTPIVVPDPEIITVIDDTTSDYCPPESDLNGNGWGWDPVKEQGCQVSTSSDDSTTSHCPQESDLNGNGWGWDPVKEQGCQVSASSDDPTTSYCPPESDLNGNGWGWDPVKEQGCQVSTSSDDSTTSHCPPESDLNGNGWGWDPVKEQGCEIAS